MHRLVLFFICILPNYLFGQDIRVIFKTIPLDAFPSSGIRKYLEDNRDYLAYKGNLVQKEELEGDEIYIDTIDVKNGYLKFTSIRQNDYAYSEMCYWKTNSGNKLIAVNYNYCMINCGSILKFYDLVENSYIKHDYPSSIMDMVSIDMFIDFEKSKVKNKNDKAFISSFDNLIKNMFGIMYILPQSGKDIKAIIDCGIDENKFVYKTKEIILEWDGKRFNIKK